MYNGDYQTAIKYFEKAYDSLGFIRYLFFPDEVKEMKNSFQIQIAVAYKLAGQKDKAEKILEEILERCESLSCKENCKTIYKNWHKTADKPIEQSHKD